MVALIVSPTHPDVLQLFAVDWIQATVCSHQFHSALDVNVGDDATLVVLECSKRKFGFSFYALQIVTFYAVFFYVYVLFEINDIFFCTVGNTHEKNNIFL